MSDYVHTPHPRTVELLQHLEKPVTTHEILHTKIPSRFNAFLAVKITDAVGTMWCAYVFAALALIGLPTALKPGGEGIIAWIAQTFLQLVLLSIIIVGQNIQAAATDQRSQNTYKDAEAILSEALEIQKHLMAQDAELSRLLHAANISANPPSVADGRTGSAT
jgi:cobalamin biosynthesis protein CobD/CbiB